MVVIVEFHCICISQNTVRNIAIKGMTLAKELNPSVSLIKTGDVSPCHKERLHFRGGNSLDNVFASFGSTL